MNVLAFIMIFIIPKFEAIFRGFKMQLPWLTEALIAISRWSISLGAVPLFWLLLLILANVLLFSSKARWYFPVVSWVYRGYARGQFLRALGLMLETDKPLPDILDRVLESGLLPGASSPGPRQSPGGGRFVDGVPLAESLVKHGLATKPMQGLIVSAEKARNLPWALQEMGDSLIRRSARVSYRVVMVLFPLMVFALAVPRRRLVAFAIVFAADRPSRWLERRTIRCCVCMNPTRPIHRRGAHAR